MDEFIMPASAWKGNQQRIALVVVVPKNYETYHFDWLRPLATYAALSQHQR
ncbi:MAG: hypothetical protein J4G18_14505 [Anaerolineae bacterium]|nr:hypothetical protein [Anaerolineae bacterium]